jgi:long-chain acyl-CoA synthetase
VPTSAIVEQFSKVCRDMHGTIAIRTLPEGEAITFAELAREWTSLARAMAELGVRRGTVVVSLVGNRPVFFPLLVACMQLGAALVPLGEATDAEASALIRQAGATAIVTDRELPFRAARESTTSSGVRLLQLPDHEDGCREDRQSYGDCVLLKLTSGSTHLPKAAIASELHLINDGRHIIDAMGIEPEDINLAYIPLSHSYAIGNVVMPLLWQGTGVALRQTFNPSQFAHDVSVTGATVFPGVPFMFDRLTSSEAIDRLPATLRLLITAGARIDSTTVSWFQRRLGKKVHSFYGSSETGGIAYDDSEELSEPLHVGHAMPETTVTVRQTGAGAAAGRVFVRGNAVALGYAREGCDPVARFCRGGFLTADLGYFDGQQRLVLTGRASALVNVAGRKVDPAEVERRLLELPGIADARVLGMACDRRGQQVVAFVVRADSALTPLAIRQLCAETLSTHKIPRRFVFVDRFPVDSRGKIDRRALYELASSAGDV